MMSRNLGRGDVEPLPPALIRPLPIARTVLRMQPMTRAQLCSERAEHMLNVRVLTDELADELPKTRTAPT